MENSVSQSSIPGRNTKSRVTKERARKSASQLNTKDFTGTVWKLETRWGSSRSDFYEFIKSENIVIGEEKNEYESGDLVAVCRGFFILAIVEVKDHLVPVTENPNLEKRFYEYGIEYKSWVKFAQADWYELQSDEIFKYDDENENIVVVFNPEVRKNIIGLWNKYKSAGKEQNSFQSNFNINLQRDGPSAIDHLGRMPFVNALRQYIDRLWNAETSGAYTIHINGEWGSGKSTVLSLLKQNLQQNNKWIVVDFNAWQNQHIQVPWWVFLDTVYKSIVRNATFPENLHIYLKEQIWRVVSMNRGKWITFLIFLLILISTMLLKSSFLNLDLLLGKAIKDKVSVIASIISLIGTVTVFISAMIHSLLPGSEDAALNYKKNVRDPMQKIKEHYTSIISYTKKDVAVFIDDIDRCEPKFVVQLLEGLQTLFRTGKVLYVIAGDASWIRESFEIHYGDLKKIINKPGQSLGNFFVEKTLQQSINLPPITPELKKAFWNILLEGKHANVNEAELNTSIQKMDEATSDNEINAIIGEATSDLQKTILRQKAAEKVSGKEILQNIEHELLKYYEFIEPNPRSMKRLVNNLALEKASNFLSGRNEVVDQDTLVKWCILKNRFPLVAHEMIKEPLKFEEYCDNEKYPEISKLMKGFNKATLTLFNA